MKDLFLMQFVENPNNYHGTIKALKKLHHKCKGKKLSKRQKTEVCSNAVNNLIRKIVFGGPKKLFEHAGVIYSDDHHNLIASRVHPYDDELVVLAILHVDQPKKKKVK